MLFNSLVFVVFASLFFLIWPAAKRVSEVRWGFLVVASLIFYGWWNWYFIFLIVFSGMIDYFAALAIVRRPRAKKRFLLLSLAGNLLSLGLFKYSGFIAANIDMVLHRFGMESTLAANIPHAFLIVPVGISFYTFQSMSYTIDVYRGNLKPTRNVLHFFAYLSMFPQLVAGPIVRAKHLLPQLEETPTSTEAGRWDGTRLIISGLFLKMMIADNIGAAINPIFTSPERVTSSLLWWSAVGGFAIQIYCDFCGYSHIARGLARWMGYRFPENFNHPYLSTSLREFWERWHISLSTWFRDYVYFPLGGNRKGRLRSHLNMWATMLLSGLWHGASWNFVIWGGLHAAYLSIERLLRVPDSWKRLRLGKLVLWPLVMLQLMVAWVFFRAEDLASARYILTSMFSFSGEITYLREVVFLGVLLMMFEAAEHLANRLEQLPDRQFVRAWLVPCGWAVLALVCVLFGGPSEQFIYFQF
jgi:D-alanyl-lipoteichoic acid acyltransferase DltB (MBOAT superfamily)